MVSLLLQEFLVASASLLHVSAGVAGRSPLVEKSVSEGLVFNVRLIREGQQRVFAFLNKGLTITLGDGLLFLVVVSLF